MERDVSDLPPTRGEARERMQRVRVGLTGLAAVGLIVMVATAVATSVRRNVVESSVVTRVDAAAASNANNVIAEKTEPLAQLGVAPDATDPGQAAKRPH